MEDPVSLSEAGDVDRQEGNIELLVMTVEIGDGRQDTIRIHENDDPDKLARAFAQKHNLEASLMSNLAMLIRQNKEMVEMRTASPDNFKWAEYSGSMSQHSASALEAPSAEHSAKEQRSPLSYEKNRGSVYERLYKQGMKKPQNVPSEDAPKAKTSSTINYGEWLYIKGMKMKETQKLKAEEERKKRETQEDSEDFTFHPAINEYSRLLSPRYFERTEDLLLRKGDNYRERKEELKRKQEEDRMKECHFVPKILSASQNVSKDSSMPVHESLYSEAERRKQKREMISEVSFKLNYGSKPSVNKSRASAVSQEEYADHLINYKKNFEEKMERAREEQLQSELSRDGKPMFTPETGKSPPRREGNVFENLYSKKDDKKNKINQEYENILQKMAASQAASKVSSQSQKMVDQRRGKQYARIFTLMDSDGDGKISAEAIELEMLDDKTLQVLTPLFQLIDSGAELDIAAFVSFMEELWDKLSLDQKGVLLKRNPKQFEDSKESLSINPNSSKLAEKVRSNLPGDMYERQVSAAKLKQMRLEKEKEIKAQEVMEECTFKPTINKPKKK